MYSSIIGVYIAKRTQSHPEAFPTQLKIFFRVIPYHPGFGSCSLIQRSVQICISKVFCYYLKVARFQPKVHSTVKLFLQAVNGHFNYDPFYFPRVWKNTTQRQIVQRRAVAQDPSSQDSAHETEQETDDEAGASRRSSFINIFSRPGTSSGPPGSCKPPVTQGQEAFEDVAVLEDVEATAFYLKKVDLTLNGHSLSALCKFVSQHIATVWQASICHLFQAPNQLQQ